ncbi:MAG TPA: hypothetical protein VEU98_00380 [Candidatus Eremiobacteraceae bacterium]|nr:hypothetical protein [Candidatus Eremiobacteraceae bacterium]
MIRFPNDCDARISGRATRRFCMHESWRVAVPGHSMATSFRLHA